MSNEEKNKPSGFLRLNASFIWIALGAVVLGLAGLWWGINLVDQAENQCEEAFSMQSFHMIQLIEERARDYFERKMQRCEMLVRRSDSPDGSDGSDGTESEGNKDRRVPGRAKAENLDAQQIFNSLNDEFVQSVIVVNADGLPLSFYPKEGKPPMNFSPDSPPPFDTLGETLALAHKENRAVYSDLFGGLASMRAVGAGQLDASDGPEAAGLTSSW